MERMSEMFMFDSDSLLLRLLAKTPDDPALLDGHAFYHYMLLFNYGVDMWGMYTDSICMDLIEKAADANVSAKASYQLGLVNTYNGNFTSAVKYFKQALAKDDTMWNAYYNMGYAYYNLEKYSEAVACFRKSYNGYEDLYYKGDAANAVGLIHYKHFGNADSALHYYNKAIMCDSTNLSYHLNRLELFVNEKAPVAYEQMITCWQLAMEDIDNNNLFSDLGFMMELIVDAGRGDEAVRYLKSRADQAETSFEKAMACLYAGQMIEDKTDSVDYLRRAKGLFEELEWDDLAAEIQMLIDEQKQNEQ